MKFLYLILFSLVMLAAAKADEPKTYSVNENNAKKVGKEWGLGYVRKPFSGKLASVFGADLPMKSFSLDMFPHEQTQTMNQGGCGSCVIFSFAYNFEESLRLRGIKIPSLSQQHLMSCGSGGQCSGAYGEEIAADLVRLGKLHTLADYPYTASNGSCKTKPGELYGQIASYLSIDPSVKNILASIHNGQPVSVGIAANGSFGGYSGGIYNSCNSSSVNHYVVVIGVDCETSVDINGYCKFDANGNLPNGIGTFQVQNSWGNSYGVKGRITMKITDKSGHRCNAIASQKGDAQVLDIGVPMPEDKPVNYSIENKAVKLDILWKPGGGYTVDDSKREFQKAADSLLEVK